MTMDTDTPTSHLMSQLDLQTLVLNMQKDITAHQSALIELNTLKSTIMELKTKNDSLTLENENLRQQLQNLQVSKADGGKPTSNHTKSGNKAPNSTNKASPGTTKAHNSWVEVTKKSPKVRNPTQVTDKHRAALTRGFNLTDGPQGYTTVYIHRSRRFTRTEVRNNLHLLGAEASRIVDITFPARNVIGILIHLQFKEEFVSILKKNKVAINLDFDPVDPKHLADPKYRELSISKREDVAFNLQINRCSKSLEYLANRRSRLFASVSNYFLEQGWTTTEEVEALTPVNSVFGSSSRKMRGDSDTNMTDSEEEI